MAQLVPFCNRTTEQSPMTNIEKMIHLQSLLKGEVYALVIGYGCNNDTYLSSLQRLKERFGSSLQIDQSTFAKLN